ncbi:Gfo/Idh/MocA family oxidoreductase [Alsobacter sp. SYSU M60028]|uniref:Gfo/Idh/MocA family oxidoreductase n=1 Tax=Alsobacter ponti TaxID=2962936 RepID=A0ABT1L6H2_9HYPH|nr:Gfo/Idh/MocA family oxidoreductase [Alsobacter ponti]MCP8936952.1 Gfo/Idh/MocA family oxidoreductase [Alsobacter ponti]
MSESAKPVVWGVLGVARIATEKVVPGMLGASNVEVRGIASRDLDKARKAAAALGLAKAYGSYEELLADPEIEAVYNPLPNHLHVPWTIKAMDAGKHVLCEKPIALTAEEAEALVEARGRTGRLVAEAFMVRHHPQWLRAREIARSGEIGELRSVNVLFNYNNTDPANIRNRADIGGGALYDIGCYAVAAARYFFAEEPRSVVALIDRDPAMKTDRLTSGLAEFGGGRQLVFSVSTQTSLYQRVQVLGDRGRVEIQVPFNPVPARASTLVVDDGRDVYGSGVRIEEFPPCDQYGLQGAAFSRAVRGEEALAFPLEDAIANMRVIDALFRSARGGAWETV